MFAKLVAALLVVNAAAFAPAPLVGSRVVQSRVAPAYEAPLALEVRAPAATMSAVTERDADGNPVVHAEMLDVVWVGITMSFFLYLLIGVFGPA